MAEVRFNFPFLVAFYLGPCFALPEDRVSFVREGFATFTPISEWIRFGTKTQVFLPLKFVEFDEVEGLIFSVGRDSVKRSLT